MYTHKHQELVDRLNLSLLHCRFSKESFESKAIDIIKHITGVSANDIHIHWDITQQSVDYTLSISIDNEKSIYYGYIDVYYLKMREDICEEFGLPERFYVTELEFDFE